MRLFGRRRGTGESIWEVKQRVGLLTPELHLYFTEPLTAAEAAATGFADVVVYHPATPAQRAAVRAMFGRFGLAAVADRPFARLSTGEQRLVLLVRALVKRPPLLILDEPFQGLDLSTMAAARDRLDRELAPEQTVLFVTHHADEVPRTVTRTLRLDRGRAAGIGVIIPAPPESGHGVRSPTICGEALHRVRSGSSSDGRAKRPVQLVERGL